MGRGVAAVAIDGPGFALMAPVHGSVPAERNDQDDSVAYDYRDSGAENAELDLDRPRA